jgi:hypothetical protein
LFLVGGIGNKFVLTTDALVYTVQIKVQNLSELASELHRLVGEFCVSDGPSFPAGTALGNQPRKMVAAQGLKRGQPLHA